MLNYQNVYKEFIKEVPEAKEGIDKRYSEGFMYEDAGQYVFLGSGVLYSLREFLKNDTQNIKILSKFFNFFEKMSNSSDDAIKSLLMYGVLEDLGDDRQALKKARKYMGKETLALSIKVETFWGREKRNR